MKNKLIEGSGPVVAAKNIRMELKANFPGVVFEVKTKKYSMGNNITIHYTDGPSYKDVQTIVSRYEAGSFDGMVDLYTYNPGPVAKRFGSAKYIFINRSFSDSVVETAIKHCHEGRNWSNQNMPTVNDYHTGNLYQWQDGYNNLREEVGKVLNTMGVVEAGVHA